MKIFSYILMTLSILTFSLISMEDHGSDTPVTLSGNKRKRNSHERQPKDLETVFQELSDVLPLPEQKAFIPGNFFSTISDDAYHSSDHYQASNSPLLADETQVAALGLLASDTLAQNPQEKVARSSSRHLPKKLHHCDEPGCNKSFPSPYRLTRHKRTHTNERPHKCNWQGCNQAFSLKENLKRHTDTHTGEKPHKCDYQDCNKAYTDKSGLRKHYIRCHTTKESHKCDQQGCNKSFKDESALITHKRSHTSAKPHICNEPDCNKAFARPYQLTRHKCIHTGEKPHKCDYPHCDKAYPSAGDLKKHKKKHTVLLEEAS